MGIPSLRGRDAGMVLKSGLVKSVGSWEIHRTVSGAVWAIRRTPRGTWTASHTDAQRIMSLKSIPGKVKSAMVDALAERYEIK